jgi:putative nucleotidyltransferase with HDIG domain
MDRIGQIVEQDVALTAKLLQLVNSAFFGLARDVTSVKTAVSCLGLTIVHDLVLTVEVFRSFKANEFVSEEYLEEFHRHAQLAARIAAGIAQKSQASPGIVLAALLHDVGKLVIAERTPAHFARAIAQAHEERKPLFEIEERLIHLSHAEVGAYLLSLWGLPSAIVEAVAHHHHPRRVPVNGLDMVLLVFVTNLLVHEREALEQGAVPPAFDMELLEQAGLADHLPEWRKIAEAAQAAAPSLSLG